MLKESKFCTVPPLPPPKRHSRPSISSNLSLSPSPSPKTQEISQDPSFIDYTFHLNIPSYIAGIVTVLLFGAGGRSPVSLVVIASIGALMLTRPTKSAPTSKSVSLKHHALPSTPHRARRSPSPQRFDDGEIHAFRPYAERRPSTTSVIYSGEDIKKID